jgi:GNAT superfamily N-acetyltransferase
MHDSIDRAIESSSIFISAWDSLAADTPTFKTRRGGLIEVSWMGHPFAFANLAILMRTPTSLAELTESIVDTAAWAEPHNAPWLLALANDLTSDLLPQTAPCLESLGLTLAMTLTGMEAAELAPPLRPLPEAECLTEADPEIGGKMLRLNELAYEVTFAEPGSLPWERPNWWRAPARLATVLVRDGVSAASAIVADTKGLRYVGFVATHPDMQRQGYAEAAMRNVLDRAAAAGLKSRTYLHATAAGRPVYERMGYRPTAEYTVYMKLPA